MDKNEKYDKSCKNAMNVVMSKKSLQNFIIQFVKKNVISGSKTSSEDKYPNVTTEARNRKKSKFLHGGSCHR